MNAGVILFLIFAVCVLIGVPISMSLGIGSLAAVALGNLGVSPAVIAQRVFGGLQSTSIMAIAFFILAGNLMAGGGISRRIVNFANCLIGNIRGGMSSVAKLFVAQMQDWLDLGAGHRMNIPGTSRGNWEWRMLPGEASKKLAGQIREMTRIYGRS